MSYTEYDKKALSIQKLVFQKRMNGRKVNSFRSYAVTSTKVLESGVTLVNDLQYGKTYPNSFFDIWYADKVKYPNAPTFVYIHGGGCLFGDKAEGDPLAVVNGEGCYYRNLPDRGFNVVTINYCLSPKYRAPTQIRQLNDFFDYLIKNGERLNLDTNNIILGGGSAGANLSALYALAVCEESYANKLGFKASINKESIKAVVIDEMCLDPSIIKKNESLMLLHSTWIGSSKLDGRKAHLMNVTEQLCDTYLPAFIVASNFEDEFRQCALPMHEKLNKIGIKNEFYYVSQEIAGELKHGFVNNFNTNQYSKECYERILSFIGDCL